MQGIGGTEVSGPTVTEPPQESPESSQNSLEFVKFDQN
jgi:hypothetical protein